MEETISAGRPRSRYEDAAAPVRLIAMDVHRGLIMVLMAIDHASYFIARVHPREIWGAALPIYPDVFWFWTRWVTHPCATGFFFLLGAAMALFTQSRLQAGWGEGRITGFFVKRGLFLIFLQLVVENTAWALSDISATAGVAVIRGGPMPGGGTDGMIYFGVLFALGGSMIFWAFARRAGFRVIALTSLAAVVATQFSTPGPDRVTTLYSPFARLLLIPGHTNAWEVLYPVVPWLGVTGMGLILGRLLENNKKRTTKVAGWMALVLFVFFVVVRVAGSFGNLGEVPPGWVGFLNVVKYPPSMAFLTVTLAINLVFVSCWTRVEPWLQNPHNPFALFGRTALFFYLLHLWIYALLGFFLKDGCTLATMYLFWFLGLLILYPVCRWYDSFKSRKRPGSIWRFF